MAFEKHAVVVRGEGRALSAPLGVQPHAEAWVLKEALERVPAKVTVDEATRARLKADESLGEVRELGPAQVAGARCKHSDRVIAFDEDARLCPRCGEVYHKEKVPDVCPSCSADLADLRAEAAKV